MIVNQIHVKTEVHVTTVLVHSAVPVLLELLD